MRLDHPLNVNHKYTTYFKIVPEEFVGEGIKRTNKYTTRLSREEVIQKREEFWETRIEGRLESW
jgi:Ubiquitin-binding domain